jgi:cell wall-associated NlpC family hydrolase
MARIFKRTVLASLCAATVLGVVGVPGAQADGRTSNNSGNVYVVKPGEWLARIAAKNGISLNALLAVNGFEKTTVIHPGQTIKLPASAKTAVAAPASAASSTSNVAVGGSYVVRAGDSLSRIASRSGVTLNALLMVNGFQRSTVILPGQTINLPSGAANTASTPSAPVMSAADGKVAKLVEFARAQVGKPYRFGAAGPDAYDCSGLVRAAFRQIGISLPHSSLEQSKRGMAVDWRKDEIRPGDLVFTFSSSNPTQISHVGIAISDTQWIEAPFTGADVRITRMPSDSRIQAVRRIVTG